MSRLIVRAALLGSKSYQSLKTVLAVICLPINVLVSKITVYPISRLSISSLRRKVFSQEMYVHWSRMHTGFCRNPRHSNVLSNLGANRSCDHLKIHIPTADPLFFLFLRCPMHSQLRNNAPFCDNKNYLALFSSWFYVIHSCPSLSYEELSLISFSRVIVFQALFAQSSSREGTLSLSKYFFIYLIA